MTSGRLTILGGGLAGLGAAHCARRSGIPFNLFEAEDRVGGHCITLSSGDFRFDSGAHRLHDKNAEIMADMKALLDGDLVPIVRPCRLHDRRGFVDYPVTPRGVLRILEPAVVLRAGFEIAAARMRGKSPLRSFEDYAVARYGRTLAERFLLNYTEKLWGIPCRRLPAEIAAKRFKGFDPAALALHGLRARRRALREVDSAYYYPEGGIGTIAERLKAVCGEEFIRTGAPVTGLEHDGRRLRKLEIGGRETLDVNEVVSTIPLDLLIRCLRPEPPERVLEALDKIRFRNVVLAAFFLDRPSVSAAAVIYFPDPSFSVIRVYEPKIRNERMSPPGKTSLVGEIPCATDDAIWRSSDSVIVDRVRADLLRAGLLKEGDILGTFVHRMSRAYPVLDMSTAEAARIVLDYAASFANLKLAGRNATLRYLWMHEVLAQGRDAVAASMKGVNQLRGLTSADSREGD